MLTCTKTNQKSSYKSTLVLKQLQKIANKKFAKISWLRKSVN